MSKTGYCYKIFSKVNPKLVYYGSTTQKYVSSRISTHKSNYKKWKNGELKSPPLSYLVLDTGDWDYMTLEKVLFDDKFELLNRERWYIENNECVNKCVPNRTKKEWCKDNPEKVKAISKKYCENNKEKAKERQKKWRENNPEKAKENQKKWRENNREKAKENSKIFYEKNKDKINTKTKIYYEKNKEILNEKSREKYQNTKQKN